jgi:leucine proline-enriched proteoglycan (leprecan)
LGDVFLLTIVYITSLPHHLYSLIYLFSVFGLIIIADGTYPSESIHFAEQVVQFSTWKASDLQTSKVTIDSGKVVVVQLSQGQREKMNCLKSVFLKDPQLAEMIFSCMTINVSRWLFFDWADFISAVALWEDYASKLREELVRSLPYWRTHQSIFEVPNDGC